MDFLHSSLETIIFINVQTLRLTVYHITADAETAANKPASSPSQLRTMVTFNLPTLLFLLSIASSCKAFLPTIQQKTHNNIVPSKASSTSSSTSLHGIQEWRDQAYEEHFTLDIYNQANPDTPPQIPATVPILPFPFTDILMQGERKQLNLYETRFHDLFSDAMENHHGMVGMGLLLGGRGMITTLPLCEVESFTRFGADEDWVDPGNGMGNGSIFVTIRAVGRAKIVESDLIQEEPYFLAKVVEVMDEPLSLEAANGIKEKGSSEIKGVSDSPVEIASLVAATIDNLMVSLSSMEHKLSKISSQKEEAGDAPKVAEEIDAEGGDDGMNKRLEAARLEEMFMKDSSEGVDLESNARGDDDVDESDEEDDDDDDDDSEILDRVAQFQEAFDSAKETDHQGYILQPTTATDNLSNNQKEVPLLRSPKDLAAISWAAFCTGSKDGSKDSIQRQAMQIQALDMTNVIQRMQLASAMLREEQKSLTAKLALAGIQDIFRDGDAGVGDESS